MSSTFPLAPVMKDALLDLYDDARDDYRRAITAAVARVRRWPDSTDPEWTSARWHDACRAAHTDDEQQTIRRYHALRAAVLVRILTSTGEAPYAAAG